MSLDRALALQVIQRGYRQLARECHPDAGGDHERAVALNATTEWLRGLVADAAPGGTARPPLPWCRPYDARHVTVCSVACVRTTVKALLVAGPWGPTTAWVPYSQLHEESEVQDRGDRGALVITAWIAEQKGWLA